MQRTSLVLLKAGCIKKSSFFLEKDPGIPTSMPFSEEVIKENIEMRNRVSAFVYSLALYQSVYSGFIFSLGFGGEGETASTAKRSQASSETNRKVRETSRSQRCRHRRQVRYFSCSEDCGIFKSIFQRIL